MIGKLLGFIRGKQEVDAISEAAAMSAQLESRGYAHLQGVLAEEVCDAICASFDAYVEANREEADSFLLATARHSRLTNLHLVSDAARSAIANPRVMAVLDAFFGERAFVATSLFFEQSSEQAVHRDTPFFHTRPNNLFAGIWFALEDVHPDAGPLQYFPGGHRLVIEPIKVEATEELGSAFAEYTKRIAATLDANGMEKEIAIIRKGDCFIWHPELPHGGTPILQPGMTRKSMVFHCAPEGETMYGIEEFFGVQPFAPKEIGKVPMTSGRRMLHHARPMFAHNS